MFPLVCDWSVAIDCIGLGINGIVAMTGFDGKNYYFTNRKAKDKLYPFGIDDLELIDGVYQKLIPKPEKFYAEVRMGGKVVNSGWITMLPPDTA